MRATRRHRVTRQGQVLVIFAVFGLVLFGVVGLAIDSGRAYAIAAHELQAAKAGALAGVPYMPGDITSATNAAKVEAARNGYADGDTTGGRNVVVTTTQPTGTTNQFQVTVSDTIGTSLMSLFGFGNFTVKRTATGYYLPPINLGQPNNQMGQDISSLNSQSYYMLTEGWSVARSQGDPFTPTPHGDWNYAGGAYANSCDVSGSASCQASPADQHLLSGNNGTDLNSAFGVSLPPKGGYNYLLWVPTGQTADIQVYNPANDPDAAPSNWTSDYVDFANFPQTRAASDLAAMTYTVFKETNLFSHLSDTAVSTETFLPMDMTGGSGSTCSNTYCTYDSAGTKTTNSGSNPFDYHQWIDILRTPSGTGSGSLVINQHLPNANLAGGSYYRVRVDTMDWYGRVPTYTSDSSGPYSYHGYAMKVTGCTGCTLGAINDMCLFTPVNSGSGSGTFNIPLFDVPKEYKGQTLAVYLFAVGDVNGGADLRLTYPTYNKVGGGTVASANASATGMYDLGPSINGAGTGINAKGYLVPPSQAAPEPAYLTTATGSGSIYRGVWLKFLITVPTNYDGPSASGYWSLAYDVSGSAHDAFSVQVSLTGGSPVHLLP